MALNRVMTYAVKRLTDLLRNYSAKQGWKDCRLFFRLNEEWDKIHVIVVTDAFNHENDDTYDAEYSSIRKFLRENLADDPDLDKAVGFSFYSSEELPSIGQEFMEPEDLLATG